MQPFRMFKKKYLLFLLRKINSIFRKLNLFIFNDKLQPIIKKMFL